MIGPCFPPKKFFDSFLSHNLIQKPVCMHPVLILLALYCRLHVRFAQPWDGMDLDPLDEYLSSSASEFSSGDDIDIDIGVDYREGSGSGDENLVKLGSGGNGKKEHQPLTLTLTRQRAGDVQALSGTLLPEQRRGW